MVQIIKNILLNILLITGIIQYSFENAILEYKSISNQQCNSKLGRYLFDISADLSGDLSKSYFDKIKIETTENNPNIIIKCDFPETNSGQYSIEVSIPCYIENFKNYNYYTLNFKEDISELQLNHFEGIPLGFISCQKEITLVLGEIKDQICDESGSNLFFKFKIDIFNNTIIPEDLIHSNAFFNIRSEKGEPGTSSNCFVENNKNLFYLDCKIELYRSLDNSLFLEKGDFFDQQYMNNNYQVSFINNETKYISKNIFCYNKHKVNYLDIFKGFCKNGAYYFSIDFEDLIDDEKEKNEMINSKKSLIELKGKVDSKSSKNYCYLDDRNEKDKYDLSKYKLNCVVPTFDDVDDKVKFYQLFSKYNILNYLSLLLFNDKLYCFKEKNYITAFYFYSDECSNNKFKILTVTTFNELNRFNSTLDDKIEILIISPFNDKAICQISSKIMEPYTEFICTVNNNQININNYEKITFGNITTRANYDDIYPIEFDGFSGEKYFGRYCSKNKTKCNEIIEYDYGVNSLNRNNPKIYEYSLCLISNENYELKKYFEIEFNNEVIGNCSTKDIYNLDNIKNNISQYKVNCSINEKQLDKFPLLKHFNPINFTFYNNAFKDFNVLTNDLLNISEINFDLQINVSEVKDYCILNETYALIFLSCNTSSPKDEIERILLDEISINNFHLDGLLNYKFDNILENDMNIIFVDYNLNKSGTNGFRELELICLVEGNFTKLSNIEVKNSIVYKTFYNNITIIWKNKALVENLIFNGNYGIYFSEDSYYSKYNNYYSNYNGLSFQFFIYSIYNFSFFNENEEKSDSIAFNIKINNDKSEDSQLFCDHPYLYKNRSIYYIYGISCYSKSNGEYMNKLILNKGDFVTFEESNYKIKNMDNKELKIYGLNILSYKHLYDNSIGFNSQNNLFCNNEGFAFKLDYYMHSYSSNENMTKYMINNFKDPTTYETINGTCKFNNNINTYYQELSCLIKSPLIDINSIYFNNTYLDRENNSLPSIKILQDFIDFEDPIFCAKNLVFAINKIKEADCVDNTYQFKLIGTLSKEVKKMNKIFIRDIIGNDLKIYCNNLSYYEKENNINYYSFNCYVVNDTSNKDYLNITLLDRPLFSDIISIKYSNDYQNVPLILKYKCNNGNDIKYRFRELYNEFKTTINSINDLFDLSKDIDYNIFSSKILLEMDGYEKSKLSDLYDKYFENYLTLPIRSPYGMSFCYLKEKNISRVMILECFGIVYYSEIIEEDIIFKNINSLNIHGNDKYSQHIEFIGLINQLIDENDIVYPKYIINSISSKCFNNQYSFNITGVIDNNDYYDESIPKNVDINLENDLWAECEVLSFEEISKLITACNVISNSSLKSLNGVNIKFNKSKLGIDDENMIIDGLNDYLKTYSEIIGMNVTCGISNPIEDNFDKTDSNYNIDNNRTENISATIPDSSENISTTEIYSSENISATIPDSSENISTTEIYSSENISTTIPYSSENISITEIYSSENISTTIPYSSEIISTTIADSSENILTTIPYSSEIISTTIADSSENISTTIPYSSENILTTEIISSENISTTIPDSSESISNNTLFETDEHKIDETPEFTYSYIDDGHCSGDSYIFNIYGNLSNNSNILIPEIELEININNIDYNTTCILEKIQNKNVTHKFKCNFIPHQYFNKLKIYPKSNFSNLKILDWEDKQIIIENENICTKEIINSIKFNYSNACDINSNTFSFEIEMESTIKEGYIKNKSLILNISKPDFIDEIDCILITRNLSSNLKFKCEINNLSQEKRITDGIFINGMIRNNIFDEYFITENNEYIKINDLYGAKFRLLECPQNFEIMHCKALNKTERKCLECYKNYYLNGNQSECLTCSQLHDGCSSCNINGSCTACLEGFSINGSECVIKGEECAINKYGPECKTCKEIDSNCKNCSKSGFCLKCEKGYYLSGIDKNSKCIKCLSTCEECDSINKCTKCNDGLILNNGSCGSCLLYIDGCEQCSGIDKCDKCYNSNLLNYKLNNSKLCEKQNEQKKEVQIKLKFERLDGYQNEDNKIIFKTHFLLLNDILYNSKLVLLIIIQMKNINPRIRYRYLRQRRLEDDITSKEQNVTCDQYGDSLGNINGGYLVNYKCSFEKNEGEDGDYELNSIKIDKMEIKGNDDTTLQNFEPEKKEFDVNEIESSSLDEQNYSFNKMKIKDILDVILKDQLTFNIIGDLDSQINGEKEYEISLKDNNKENVNSTCKFKTTGNNLVNQIISCSAEIDKKKTEYLTFENGMFASKTDNKDIIILNTNDDVVVTIPEKKGGLSAGAIVGIIIAGLVFIAVAAILIYKFLQMNKKKKSNGRYRTKFTDNGSKEYF